jgi:hypothetical protein
MSLQSWQRRFAAQLDAAELPEDPGMQVYHHNVRAQFRKALAVSFPVVADLLGESRFNVLAERFRQRNPSRSGDLHPSGGAFPGFLVDDANAAVGAIIEPTRAALGIDLSELAHLEWAWQCALIATERPSIDASSLSRFPPDRWPSLALQLQPSFTVPRGSTPVISYWQAHRERAVPVIATATAIGPEQAWLIGTPRGPILQHCNAATAEWLEALRAGASLARALDAAERPAEIDITTTLQHLFSQGAVVSVDLRADDHA